MTSHANVLAHFPFFVLFSIFIRSVSFYRFFVVRFVLSFQFQLKLLSPALCSEWTESPDIRIH